MLPNTQALSDASIVLHK